MVNFGALADLGAAIGKGVNAAPLTTISKSGDALGALGKGSSGLKLGSSVLGDAGKLRNVGGAGADLGKVGGAGADLGRAGGAGADLGRAGGAGADLGRAGGAAGDAGRAGGAAGDAGRAGGAAGDAGKAGGAGADVAKVADDADGVLAWARKNPGKALAGAGASAAALYAANSYMANDGKKVGITKIEAGTEGSTKVAKITFTPDMDALLLDKLKIEGTDSTPSVDGASVSIFKVYSPTQVAIKVDAALSAPGTKGALTLSTTMAARAGDAVGSASGAAGTAAGTAAGAAVGGALEGLGLGGSGGLGGLLPGGAKSWLIGCGVFCCMMILLFVIMKFI